MEFDENYSIADGHFQSVPLIADYIKKCLYQVDSIIQLGGTFTPKEERLYGLCFRALCWMQSLQKLNFRLDFQPILTSTRGLLEITLDMIFIYGDQTGDMVERLLWWEKSAKLETAEKLKNYYENQLKVKVPDIHDEMMNFIQREKNTIEQKRLAFWPSRKKTTEGRHPMRWTDHDLRKDSAEADKTYAANAVKDELGMSLEEFYVTQMSKLNWSVHGSGLILVHKAPPSHFENLCAFGFNWSCDLALFCSKLILYAFDFVKHNPDLKQEWQNIKETRILRYAERNNLLDEIDLT